MVNFYDMEKAAQRKASGFNPMSVCAAILDAIKNSKGGLSPREIRITLDYEFKDIRQAEVLYGMSWLAKEGLIRESDESGVFEYCGGLK